MTADRGTVGTGLDWSQALDRADLLAGPVAAALRDSPGLAGTTVVAEIDPDVADTAAFCDRYAVRAEESANCVVVAGKRAGETSYAACMVLATTRADVNTVVRKRLAARKASFAQMDDAVALTGMEYGGITPIGLPPDWLVLVDSAVAAAGQVVVGSGVRRSKLALPGTELAALSTAEVVDGLGVPVT